MAVTAADLQIKFSSDTRAAEAGIDRMGSKVKGLGGVMQTALGTAGGFLLGGIIQGAARQIGGLVDGAIAFEANMANVNSIAQLTDSQIKDLSADVNALATETAQSPQVLAAGLYDIYSSGFQGAEAIDVLTASAKAATAGLTDTSVSAKAITSVLNAYTSQAYDAAEVSDILFKVVEKGVITFPELAANMANTLAPANALKISFEELAAAYAQMTLQGVSGAQAETQIASLMKSAANPTDALTAATQAYGYETTQALLAAEGLPGLLKVVNEAAGGNTEALYDMLGTQEAVNAAMILGADDGKAYADMLWEMEHAAGATDKALNKQAKSSAFAMKQAKVAFQQAATVLIGALSPAIQLVARGFAFFAAEGLTPAFELIGRILDPIGRFAGLLGEVFGSGQGVQDLFNVLFGPGAAFKDAPQFVKELAYGLLEIADAFGDIWAAFQSGGLAGVADVLGEEVSNILDTVGRLAKITLDLVVSIASVAWETTVNLYDDLKGWIGSQLGLGGAGTPDATNATAGMTGSGLSIGTVAVAVAGWAITALSDLYDDLTLWVGGQFGLGGSGSPDATNATAGMTGGIPLGTLAVAITDWAITSQNSLAVRVLEFFDLQATETQAQAEARGRAHGEAIGRDYWSAFADAMAGAADFLGSRRGGGGAGGPGGRSIMQTVYDFTLGLDDTIDLVPGTTKIELAFKEFGAMVEGIAVGFAGGFADAFTGLMDDIVRPIENLQFDLQHAADGLYDALQDASDTIMDGLDALGNLGTPHLPNWLTNNSLTKPIEQLAAGISRAAGLLGTAWDTLQAILTRIGGESTPNQPAFMPFGMGGDAPGTDLGLSGEQFRPQEDVTQTVTVTLVPMYQWDTAAGLDAWANKNELPGVGPTGGGGMLTPLKAFVDVTLMPGTIDTSNVDTAAETALSGAKASVEQTFTATFLGDNSDVALKYTDAMAWGGIWGGSTFTGIFGADNGAVAVAYTEAFGWGETWAAQTFTASFSVDTSGITNAVAVARQAAADIAAVMPHSPAREGPLSEPIRFDFIADNLRAAMARMGPTAESGMGAVADRLGRGVGFDFAGRGVYGSDGAGGGTVSHSVTVNINAPVYGVDELENVIVDTYMAKVVPGLTVALGRRKRSLGQQP